MRADITFIPVGTPSSRYDIINTLPVTYADFAATSSLYHRAYGVLIGDNLMGVTSENGENLESYVLNRCARNALYRQLYQITAATEAHIGYKLSQRYLTMREPYRSNKIALPHPGVSALEVQRVWYPTELTALLITALESAVQLTEEGGKLIARISATTFENPSWAIFRNRVTGKILSPEKSSSRYGEYDAGQWIVPINTSLSSAAVSDTVDAYHRKFVRFEVTKPLPDVGQPDEATFVPVYPGTNQIIPHTIVYEGEDKITFEAHVWELVSPAFADETLDWERLTTRKLSQTVAFSYYNEEPAYLRLIWTSGSCQTVYQYDPNADSTLPRLEARLADTDRGVVHLVANGRLVEDISPWWRASCECHIQEPASLVVELPYKVDPDYLPAHLSAQIPDIQEAIIFKTAAELPVTDCGCPAGLGFVYEAQRPYDNAYMNPYTGMEIVKREYGELHGQHVYRDKMKDKHIFRRTLRVRAW